MTTSSAGSPASGIAIERLDGLLAVEGAVPLHLAAKRARAEDLAFPFARPVPAMSLAAACATLPILVEGFVSSAEGRVPGAGRLVTPRAPRSAAGPDLLGALMGPSPFATATLARIRVLGGAHAGAWEGGSTAEVASFLTDLVEEGRVFAADALGTRVVWAAGFSRGAPSAYRHAHPGPRVRSGRALVAGDRAAIAAALDAGDRVVAAPQLGRIGTLSAERPAAADAVSSSQAAAVLGQHLRASLAGGSA